VLAPESVRAVLGWPEFARLGFAATRPTGAIPIGLEGYWLDRFGTLLGERGRFAERQLAVADNVAAPSDPQRLLDRALDLPNAVWRLHDAKPTWDTLPPACVPLHRHLRRKARGTGLARLQPGYGRGHGRRLSAAPPHVLSERRRLWFHRAAPGPQARIHHLKREIRSASLRIRRFS
jgi:hypothetical protein